MSILTDRNISAVVLPFFIEEIVLTASNYSDISQFRASIISARQGSLELVFVFFGLVIGSGQLALQLAAHFRDDTHAAVMASWLTGDPGAPPSLKMSSMESEGRVSSEELRKKLISAYSRAEDGDNMSVGGFHMGRYYDVDGVKFIIPEFQPTRIMSIVDERSEEESGPLEHGQRYMFEGTAIWFADPTKGQMVIFRAVKRRSFFDNPPILP